jgi:EAL domain-containing protein (putative c-di-GMP-specific phosphodiesterase class I)/GGDEF domain-containing protein
MGLGESLKQRLSQLGSDGICARALMFGLLAATSPLVALFYLSTRGNVDALLPCVVALILMVTGLVGLVLTLRPVSVLATLVDQHAGNQADQPKGVIDHHKRILANVQAIATQLATERQRTRQHPVTGLPVREHLFTAISAELVRSEASAMLGLIRVANYDHLVAFDVAAAEQTMVQIAQRLTGAVSRGRPLAHVDRDCFAVWFGDAEPKAAAAELQAIGYVLMQEIVAAGIAVTPDIQIGSALYPVDADEPGNLLNRAFVSLARPQRTADGGIEFFARPSPREARRRFSMEQELRHAVRRGELVLHYQPFVDLAMGRVVGAEALIRWKPPGQEAATPAQVVKILEETGLVHEIGLWTLNAACRQLREWRDAGQRDLKIAVNLSAQQLRDPALPRALARTVASHGLTPSMIELELTETAAMDDAERVYMLLHELREAGFSLAIDDFGSGYSSLAYLRRLPFQKLKIDREFVSHVDARADSRTICKALVDLTAGLELAVLAEGVERFEEVETLRMMGCSTFQGYYFSRPLPAEDFITTITDPEWLALTGSRVNRERNELRRRLV